MINIGDKVIINPESIDEIAQWIRNEWIDKIMTVKIINFRLFRTADIAVEENDVWWHEDHLMKYDDFVFISKSDFSM